MKYIKKFESDSIQREITIDLLDFCEFFGGMRKAVDKLKILNNNSNEYARVELDKNRQYNISNISFKTLPNNNTFSYCITDKDCECIGFDSNLSFSYGYIKKNNADITITFFNVKDIDNNILIYLDSKKYNL